MCIWLIFKKEWVKNKKHPIRLLLTLLLPIIITCLVVLFSNQMKPSIHLGLLSESPHSDIIKSLKESSLSVPGLTLTSINADSLYSDLMTSKYAAIIKQKTDNTFEVLSLDVGLRDQLNSLLNHPATPAELPILSTLFEGRSTDSLSATSRSMSFIFLVMTITATLLAVSIHKEKSDGLLTRYGLSPHHALSYVSGFFLYNLVMTLLQIFVTASLIFIFKLPLNMPLPLFILVGILISFSSSSLAFLIIGLTHNELSASILASSIGLLLSLLGGAFLPLAKMPHGFQFFSKFTLTRWLIDATDTLTSAPHAASSYLCIVPMLLLTLVMLLLAFVLNVRKLSSHHINSQKIFLFTTIHIGT